MGKEVQEKGKREKHGGGWKRNADEGGDEVEKAKLGHGRRGDEDRRRRNMMAKEVQGEY